MVIPTKHAACLLIWTGVWAGACWEEPEPERCYAWKEIAAQVDSLSLERFPLPVQLDPYGASLPVGEVDLSPMIFLDSVSYFRSDIPETTCATSTSEGTLMIVQWEGGSDDVPSYPEPWFLERHLYIRQTQEGFRGLVAELRSYGDTTGVGVKSTLPREIFDHLFPHQRDAVLHYEPLSTDSVSLAAPFLEATTFTY